MNPFEGRPRRWARSIALLALLAIVLLGVGVLVTSCGKPAQRGAAASQQLYHCPMHPTYIADRPGNCPICGMKLVPMPQEPHSAGAAADSNAATGAAIDGHAVVELMPSEVELTGIQTVPARRGTLARTIRTVGEVKPDEGHVHHVHTKTGGWVERLFVNASGQVVSKGQPLLTLYSPELLATQEEFVRALDAAGRFEQSDVAEVRRGGQELLEAARRRLLLFDVPQKLVTQLERTRQPQRAVTLDAPVSGYVSSKEVFEGMQVEPGTTLFTITNLSRVWIEAEVYEYEAALVRVGQNARLSLPNAPGRAYSARISYVYPYLDTATRTLRVRFEFDNPGQLLKPGMYADVELQGEPANGVLIPEAAIMDTGVRQLVYVRTGPGRFEPRQVAVGARAGGEVLVLSGVRVGEAVVTQANFLLDSESRLRSAMTGPAATDTGHRHTP